MSTLTAAQTADVRIAARGFAVTAATELKAHDAILRLADSGLSARAIAAHLKATGAQFTPSHNRVALIVRTRRGLPADVTAADYATALKAETRRASGDTSRSRKPATGTPATGATPRPTVDLGTLTALTADETLTLLADLVTAAVRFDASDRARVAAALSAAASDVAPLVSLVA